jgi:death-on-curing protein
VSVRYVDLADYLAIAIEVTGLNADNVAKAANIDLADSALHAPVAGFGETELYPDFVDKAAVLVVRLTKNHPLPDGNKRCAWVALRLFVEINGWAWEQTPAVEDAERAMLAIASGDWDEDQMATWLRERLIPPDQPEAMSGVMPTMG